MDVQINKRNGESFTLEQYGIIVKDFLVSSIPLESEYGKVEGSNSYIDFGATYGRRTITVPFNLRAHNLMDFPLVRDVLFGLVNDTVSFYIREMRRPKKLTYAFVDPSEPAIMDPVSNNQFVGGKRYLVRLQNTFNIEQIEKDGEGELIFETTELPFAESIGKTQDIHQNGVADSELWSNMGLIPDKESFQYTHEGTSFRIYNAGNVAIHPFEQELKITIQGVQADSLELRNLTTNSIFKVNEPIDNQTIILDGPSITKDNLSFLQHTNKRFITLAPGWNEFTLSTFAKVSFDFRFYYQ